MRFAQFLMLSVIYWETIDVANADSGLIKEAGFDPLLASLLLIVSYLVIAVLSTWHMNKVRRSG